MNASVANINMYAARFRSHAVHSHMHAALFHSQAAQFIIHVAQKKIPCRLFRRQGMVIYGFSSFIA